MVHLSVIQSLFHSPCVYIKELLSTL
jgi:hypothetical protein